MVIKKLGFLGFFLQKKPKKTQKVQILGHLFKA